MSKFVCSGAMLSCTGGAAPGVLNVIPSNRVFAGPPLAVITDCKPFVNIMPFGVCSMKPPTPVPCTPAITGCFTGKPSRVNIGSVPALLSDNICLCANGGVIKINNPMCQISE